MIDIAPRMWVIEDPGMPRLGAASFSNRSRSSIDCKISSPINTVGSHSECLRFPMAAEYLLKAVLISSRLSNCTAENARLTAFTLYARCFEIVAWLYSGGREEQLRDRLVTYSRKN